MFHGPVSTICVSIQCIFQTTRTQGEEVVIASWSSPLNTQKRTTEAPDDVHCRDFTSLLEESLQIVFPRQDFEKFSGRNATWFDICVVCYSGFEVHARRRVYYSP